MPWAASASTSFMSESTLPRTTPLVNTEQRARCSHLRSSNHFDQQVPNVIFDKLYKLDYMSSITLDV
jgi:hypothetical protein